MKIHKVIQSKLDIKKQTCKNSETQGDKRLSSMKITVKHQQLKKHVHTEPGTSAY